MTSNPDRVRMIMARALANLPSWPDEAVWGTYASQVERQIAALEEAGLRVLPKAVERSPTLYVLPNEMLDAACDELEMWNDPTDPGAFCAAYDKAVNAFDPTTYTPEQSDDS